MKKIISYLILVLLVTSCATMKRSVGLGVGIGATTGVIGGVAVNYNPKGMIFTTLTGAVLGGVLGYVLHLSEDSAPNEKRLLTKLPPDHPLLKGAEVEKIWVPDKIDNETYEVGHELYVIKKTPVWKLREFKEGANDDR